MSIQVTASLVRDAIAEEREACAKIADAMAEEYGRAAERAEKRGGDQLVFVKLNHVAQDAATEVADAIRSRKL